MKNNKFTKNFSVAKIILLTAVFWSLSFESASAKKNDHCVLAIKPIYGNNFIAVNQDTILHLSTIMNTAPGSLLYVLPREEVFKDKPTGTFYFVESMSSSCIGWEMTLRADDGSNVQLIGSLQPKSNIKCINDNTCDQFEAFIQWKTKGRYKPLRQKIHFKKTATAMQQGIDADFPA